MDMTPDDIWMWAERASQSGLAPNGLKTAEQIFFVMATGIELGLQPMASLRLLSLVKGKVTLSAESMLAMAVARGVKATWRHLDNERAELELARPGATPHTETFTLQDAQRAGLAGGDTWKKYPKAMLRSRCVSAAVKAYCPDIVGGIYTPEEADGIPDEPPRQLEDRAPRKQLSQLPKWASDGLAWLEGCGLSGSAAASYIGGRLPARWTDADRPLLKAYCEAVKAGTKAGMPQIVDGDAVHILHPTEHGIGCTCDVARLGHVCEHITDYEASLEREPAGGAS